MQEAERVFAEYSSLFDGQILLDFMVRLEVKLYSRNEPCSILSAHVQIQMFILQLIS